MLELSGQEWHHLAIEDCAEKLKTDIKEGLSREEVEKRLEKYGKNQITVKKGQGALIRFLLQFHQPLVYILLGAIFVTIFIGEYVDASVIFAVVLLNSVIGFVQESKAIKAIESLSSSMTSKVRVLRGGKKKEVDAGEVAIGDLVLLGSGDKVPADLRVVRAKNLSADESGLTGESVPVEKATKALEKDTLLADRINMLYSSSNITSGQATGMVVAIGDDTEMGKISESISTAKDIKTPLTQKIEAFSKQLLYVILGLAIVIFVIGMVRGEEFQEIFMASVAFAVSVIPEGLPAAVTIMLAIGVSKMAKRKAIIRKLEAVETLGSTTVICSDKTGTLTENQMTVQKIFAGGKLYEVSGTGYAPEGEVTFDGEKVSLDDHRALAFCLKCGLLCNGSKVVEKDGAWKVQGDPTEGAIYVAGLKAGLKPKDLGEEYTELDEIPFESEHQYMVALHRAGEENIAFIKGSMEALKEKAEKMLNEDGEEVGLDHDGLEEEAEQLASEGLRVLAFGMYKFPKDKEEISHDDLDKHMVFLGLQGMIDPPREEAENSVHLCQTAGIKVKMITGDHAATASAIAGKIGLKGKEEDGKLVAYTGRELGKLEDSEYPNVAEEIAVFARVSPDQKLKLVEALQSKGNVVAMTGDGVNDGPALKQANIGVAMGISGTEVAKDASDMVLTDDNFSSIESAVEEGRGVFNNLTKFIVWILPTNLGQGLTILTSIVLGYTLPILPVQALWVNMATAVLLGLPLAFEPNEPGIMEKPPRDPKTPILTKDLVMRTLLVGFLLLVAATGLFHYEREMGTSEDGARTVATTVFIVLQSFYLLSCRSIVRPISEIGFFSNPWIFAGIGLMLGFQVAFIYVPVMNTLFHTEPIALWSWLRVFAAGVIVFLIVAFEKWARRKWKGQG